MAIRVQRHANVSKQATLFDELDVSPIKWRVCGRGLNLFVHEGMNHISNVKVHLKTPSGNVNIDKMGEHSKPFFFSVKVRLNVVSITRMSIHENKLASL